MRIINTTKTSYIVEFEIEELKTITGMYSSDLEECFKQHKDIPLPKWVKNSYLLIENDQYKRIFDAIDGAKKFLSNVIETNNERKQFTDYKDKK